MKSIPTYALAALTFVIVFSAVMLWPKLIETRETELTISPLSTTVPDTFEGARERNKHKSHEQLAAEDKQYRGQVDGVLEKKLHENYPEADIAAMKNDAPGVSGYANFVTLPPMKPTKSNVASSVYDLNIACGSIRVNDKVVHILVGYGKNDYVASNSVEYAQWIETGCAKAIQGPQSTSMSLGQMIHSFAELIPDNDLASTRKERLDFQLGQYERMSQRPRR